MNVAHQVESIKLMRQRNSFRLAVILLLLVLCVLSFLFSVGMGSLKITIPEVIEAIVNKTETTNRQIIWNIRLPRTIVAGLVGICLSLSGGILQGVMKNPLASPSIIGVSSGAGIAATIILVLLPKHYYLIIPCAFLGSLAATLLIYALAWKGGIKPMRMVLAGVAVSSFLSAWINALMVFFPNRVHGVIDFMVGGLAARSWKHFSLLWPYALVGLVLVSILANKLNVLALGDEIATNLGVNVERMRLVLVALASLLAASAVSVVGMLGFVGLIVPHTVRLIIGSDYRYLLPASTIFGATLVMFCDTVARIAMDPIEVPVGIIMAMLGAPFFLYLLKGGLTRDVKS
ncbi:MAG TPA: iron ABC transporter permease [Oscillospiraceae bacterium]|nr:iron ABC transporter permease [Oscillospiraceae bacterium]